MRERIITYLKKHPLITNFTWGVLRLVLNVLDRLIPVRKKSMIFSSFGGRSFDDSPKALYDKICSMDEYKDWTLKWAFVEPEDVDLPRGEKIKIDTVSFFIALLSTYVWIGNSEIDRGIKLFSKKHIRIETWHGTPLKRICGEENQTSVERVSKSRVIDHSTIRCSQSEYDREIFSRIFNASRDSILLSDLPRNDSLLCYSPEAIEVIKDKLQLGHEKKIILYTPTYREYLIDMHGDTIIAPPINFARWESELGSEYVLLIRAHYAVTSAMNLPKSDFVKDVSSYPCINDLYAISDMMISDYSSTFFDYSILDRPMLCFAYDLDEYMEKRGLYLDLEKELPCPIDKDENSLLTHIKEINVEKASKATKDFHQRFAPHAGRSCDIVINVLSNRISNMQ